MLPTRSHPSCPRCALAPQIPPQVLAVFNAAARDIFLSKEATAKTGEMAPLARSPAAGASGTDSAQAQLRLALTSIHAAVSTSTAVAFSPAKRRGEKVRVAKKALSFVRGAVAKG